MKAMISELRAGVGRVNDEILAAAGAGGSPSPAVAEGAEVAAEAAERFGETMVAFQEGSTAKLKRLEVRNASLVWGKVFSRTVGCSAVAPWGG